jgi:GT2 family glycosyltransferase
MKPGNFMLSAIIVSYNTRQMTLDCLQKLHATLEGLNSEVIVVDNASTDNSVAAIRERFPDVRLIANERNTGFGAANNQAMAVARGEYFLLLNSDAFPEPDAIRALLDFMRANPKAGVTGPRTHNADGSLQLSCFRLPSPGYAWLENLWLSDGYRRWPHDAVRRVDFVIGACMLVRRDVYEQVGGFDERFFMYSEETDWQRRIHDAGWEIVFVPQAHITHLGGASGAGNRPQVNWHFFDSLDAYVRKHHGIAGLVSLRGAMAVGCLTRSVLWTASAFFQKRREVALGKARHHIRLFLRQTTHWELGK